MAVRYTCTADGCGWQREGSRKTAVMDAEEALVHRATHVDPGAQAVTELPDTVRARTRYGWLIGLAIANGVAVVLAVLGGVGEGTLGLLFPQVWAWRYPFGVGIGVVSIVAILIGGYAHSLAGLDPADRRYRFVGGITLGASIMFAACLLPAAVMLAMLSGQRP